MQFCVIFEPYSLNSNGFQPRVPTDQHVMVNQDDSAHSTTRDRCGMTLGGPAFGFVNADEPLQQRLERTRGTRRTTPALHGNAGLAHTPSTLSEYRLRCIPGAGKVWVALRDP